MAVRKANKKSSISQRRAATKKSSAKRPVAKNALKRTRRAGVASKGAVKTPRAAMPGRREEAEAGRKPIKKVEARPVRPPAVLPIPQSTFFF
jgi:hypothetical protein